MNSTDADSRTTDTDTHTHGMRPLEPMEVGIPARSAGLPRPSELVRWFDLTRREAQVARRLSLRRTNAEIAREMHVSEHTVRRHTERVLRKLRISSRRDVYGVIAAAREANQTS